LRFTTNQLFVIVALTHQGNTMQISIRTNFPEVKAGFARAGNQMPFALARALTFTGRDVKEGEEKEILAVFDRPTTWTKRSVFLQPATKQKLQARVWLKDGSRPEHYLLPQIEGGSRPLKRFEQRLIRAGHMGASERAVPGAGAQLDSYGNISRGQIVKILSQLQTAAVVGDFSNATNSKRSKAKRAKEQYFVAGVGSRVGKGSWKNGNKSQHLAKGVWVRRSFGALGTAVKPVLLFVDRVNYKRRFKFFEVADRIVTSRFPAHFEASFQEAMRTARFSVQGSLL
jgi:hypothetical protein